MLYLMLDDRGYKKLAKVGLSRDVSSRRRNYKSHNPYAIMRSTCAGTENEESFCHSVLMNNGKRISGTEWFEVSNEMFNILYEKGMGAFPWKKKKNIYFHED